MLARRDRKRFFIEFLLDGLLRGDIQSRYNAYKIGRDGGWLNPDEIREKENMNPIPGGKGKGYLQPLNMAPLGEEPSARDQSVRVSVNGRFARNMQSQLKQIGTHANLLRENMQAQRDFSGLMDSYVSAVKDLRAERMDLNREADASQRTISVGVLEQLRAESEESQRLRKLHDERVTAAARATVTDVAELMLSKEIEGAHRAANNPSQFIAKVDAFYEGHQPRLAKALRAPVAVLLAATGDARSIETVVESLVTKHCGQHRNDLLAAAECQPEELAANVTAAAVLWRAEHCLIIPETNHEST